MSYFLTLGPAYTEMRRLEFRIPGVPVPKMRPRMAKSGRVFTPARSRQYEYHVADMARDAMRDAGWSPVDGKYALAIGVTRERRSGDLDNFVKSVSDGLNGVVWPDDRMVYAIYAWFVDGDEPGVHVTVSQVVTHCPIQTQRNDS